MTKSSPSLDCLEIEGCFLEGGSCLGSLGADLDPLNIIV